VFRGGGNRAVKSFRGCNEGGKKGIRKKLDGKQWATLATKVGSKKKKGNQRNKLRRKQAGILQEGCGPRKLGKERRSGSLEKGVQERSVKKGPA